MVISNHIYVPPNPGGGGRIGGYIVLGADPVGIGVSVGVGVLFHIRAISFEPVDAF